MKSPRSLPHLLSIALLLSMSHVGLAQEAGASKPQAEKPALAPAPVQEENFFVFAAGTDYAWNALAAEYRFAYAHTGGFVLDRDGTQSPVQGFGEHRFRWSPYARFKGFEMKVEMDVVSGQVTGDHEDFYPEGRRLDRRDENGGAGFDGFLVREAYLQYVSRLGAFRVGQMTSEYGQGILANSGRDDDTRYGVKRYGDIVDRALMLFTPLTPFVEKGSAWSYLSVMLAADWVFKDENAVFSDGDEAWMANAGILYRHPRYSNAVLLTYRDQTDDDGDTLQVYALNVNGRNRFVLSEMPGPDGKPMPDLSLLLGYEAAWLFGETTRLQQTGSPDGLDVRSFGFVGKAGMEWASTGLSADLEVGYASGDDNAYDDESHAFFFDPDYKVGLIFFDEMLPLISARSAEISSDPAHSAVAPKGLDLLASQGRVTNTVYLFPQVRWEPNCLKKKGFLDSLRFMAAGLVLTTPSEFAHSYYSFENGGVPTNYLGRQTDSNYLGTELLAGVQGKLRLGMDRLGLVLRLEQSYFLPGKALEGPDGTLPDPVWKVLGTAAVVFR